jgi:hypothetical protein
MDDDLRAELEKFTLDLGGKNARDVVNGFANTGRYAERLEIVRTLQALLSRHPEPAAPSETDREKAIDEWITKRAEADGVTIKPDMPIEARINTLIAIERLQVLHEAGFTDIEITKSANSGNGFRGMVDAIRAEKSREPTGGDEA